VWQSWSRGRKAAVAGGIVAVLAVAVTLGVVEAGNGNGTSSGGSANYGKILPMMCVVAVGPQQGGEDMAVVVSPATAPCAQAEQDFPAGFAVDAATQPDRSLGGACATTIDGDPVTLAMSAHADASAVCRRWGAAMLPAQDQHTPIGNDLPPSS
jgi:hypothetical protein